MPTDALVTQGSTDKGPPANARLDNLDIAVAIEAELRSKLGIGRSGASGQEAADEVPVGAEAE